MSRLLLTILNTSSLRVRMFTRAFHCTSQLDTLSTVLSRFFYPVSEWASEWASEWTYVAPVACWAWVCTADDWKLSLADVCGRWLSMSFISRKEHHCRPWLAVSFFYCTSSCTLSVWATTAHGATFYPGNEPGFNAGDNSVCVVTFPKESFRHDLFVCANSSSHAIVLPKWQTSQCTCLPAFVFFSLI